MVVTDKIVSTIMIRYLPLDACFIHFSICFAKEVFHFGRIQEIETDRIEKNGYAIRMIVSSA